MSAATTEAKKKTDKEEKPSSQTPPVPEKAPTPEELEEARSRFNSVFFSGTPRQAPPATEQKRNEQDEPRAEETGPGKDKAGDAKEGSSEDTTRAGEEEHGGGEDANRTEKEKSGTGETGDGEATPGEEATREGKEAKPAAKPKKQAAKSTRAGRLAEPVPEDVIERAAEAGARRVVDEMRPPEQPASNIEDSIGLKKKDRRMLEWLQHMEQAYPEQYRGITARTLKFWNDEKAYKQQWMAANPGREFVSSDDEHRGFYDTNEPPIDEDDLEEAKEAVTIKKAREEAKREGQEQLRKIEAENAVRGAAPHVVRAAAAATATFVELAVPELVKEIKASGQQILAKESLEKLEDADPAAYDVLQEFGERVKVVSAEMEKLTIIGDVYKPNRNLEVIIKRPGNRDEKIYPHAEILDFAQATEMQVAKLPPEETIRDGRRFVTQGQYDQMVDSVMSSRRSPAEKRMALDQIAERFWMLSSQDIRNAYISEMADQARKRIDHLNGIFERRNKKAPAAAAPESKDGKGEAAPKPASSPKPKPPSSASSSDKTNPSNDPKLVAESQREQMKRAFFP